MFEKAKNKRKKGRGWPIIFLKKHTLNFWYRIGYHSVSSAEHRILKLGLSRPILIYCSSENRNPLNKMVGSKFIVSSWVGVSLLTLPFRSHSIALFIHTPTNAEIANLSLSLSLAVSVFVSPSITRLVLSLSLSFLAVLPFQLFTCLSFCLYLMSFTLSFFRLFLFVLQL